ncbi:pyridoxamine 5'-phosphate oxidase family protein [Haloarchaeobius sp. HRN-SO-5]|uniref:pyridoxamine 5'-phosphate oxidase family protein n=1 Tax=Haloarchaeobius sp. HRN-SO-5 TaxID=3446118 RepID=UPI003EBF15C7
MENVEYAYTRGMAESELEDRLRNTKTGVLSLAHDGEAYGIPLAHYYDGERLYFRLGDTGDTKKRSFIESTTTASYVLYGTEETEEAREIESWSVMITGTLHELTDEEREAFDPTEINRDFAPIRVFDEDIADIEIVLFEMDIDRMTGRVTPE